MSENFINALSMFRLVGCRAALPPLRGSLRQYHVASINKNLGTNYNSVEDYGSYKNTVFTHRLPESTAQQSPLLAALHARLNLPESYTYSTLSQSLNLRREGGLANNFGLNTLGKTLSTYYVSEYLLVRYPRLPMGVHNVAVNAYMGDDTLAEVGRSWGIEVETSDQLQRYLSREPEFMQYGRLRYREVKDTPAEQEPGLSALLVSETTRVRNHEYVTDETMAYASAVRSIIGGLYTHSGEAATKNFITDHILSRKVPLEQMFQFSKPTRELVRLLDKLGFQEPLEVRLVAETGRLSAHAIFVAAAFTGGEKLGEGVGSSLQEAKTRAIVNALMAYYLYTPVSGDGNQVMLPSDGEYKFEGIVGEGDVAI